MKKIICSLIVIAIIASSAVMAFSKTPGDVNSDGVINSSDALAILQYSVGSDPKNFDKDVADLNEDGRINATDALFTLMISVGTLPYPTVKPGGSSDSNSNPTPPVLDNSVLGYDKAQLIDYYNAALKKSYSCKLDATKVEQVDVEVSGIDIGNINLDVDKVAQSIIANNTKKNGVLQTKSFVDGKATDDGSEIQKFVLPTNLYEEAVRDIYVTPSDSGYKIRIVLKAETCAYNETAEYNASCTWPLDVGVIDFGTGMGMTIQECTFNYPGTVLTAMIDSQGRVYAVQTEMPLDVKNATATASAFGINIKVGSIQGKWTCKNEMKFSEDASSSNSGNSGESNKPEEPQKTPQEIYNEIKDRWGDVKLTIDADSNITVENTDGTDTGLFGFKYSTKDKCFIAAENAYHRNFGYDNTYDDPSAPIAMSYDTMRVYFEYDGLEWMIQYWKGQYGLILVGAEAGTYNRPSGSSASTHYTKASDDLQMIQSMDVYRRASSTSNEFNKAFSRSPMPTWWCTGFIPGTLDANKYNVTAEATAMLKVDSKITLHSPEMAQAFMQGLREVTHIEFNGTETTKRSITMQEFATVEEYENATNVSNKFCLEEDGVTVRVCWN